MSMSGSLLCAADFGHRAFVVVADLLNFIRAAEKLGVYSQALSEMARRLEEHVGIRHSKGFPDPSPATSCSSGSGQRRTASNDTNLSRIIAQKAGTPSTNDSCPFSKFCYRRSVQRSLLGNCQEQRKSADRN
jgi:hypothetical protein